MAFDKDLLREIKEHADIVDVISSYINVIKKGKRYVSLCPFHDDHNPSMDINKDKQTYHCYVCHHGGDVFNFVADYEKIPFNEAVKKVAEIINFDDPRLHKIESVKPINPDIQKLYDCINELQKFYEYGLQTDEGLVAKKYLSERQISDEQIAKFSLGYALNDGKKTVSYLQQKGFSLKNIEDIGIALAQNEHTADQNAGRLIFPLKNANGQVIGFSARRMDNDKNSPKYVNSPETKIFRKGDNLYNYHQAKQTAKHDGFVYIVEGFMDVFALDYIGVNSVVALMGTKLTDSHIKLLKRLNVELRLCLDGDDAGQRAMMEMMATLDKANMSYRLVSLIYEKRDPDEILKQDGQEKLNTYINSLVDPFIFALNYYKNISPLNTVEERKKVIAHFAPMLKNIKSKLEFDDYIYKLSEATHFNHNAIREYVNALDDKKTENYDISSQLIDNERHKSALSIKRELRRLNSAEMKVLSYMTSSKTAIEFYEKNIKYFTNEIYRQLANYFVQYASECNDIDITMVMDLISESNPPNKMELLSKLSSLQVDTISDEELKEALNDCYKVIEEERTKVYERDLISKAIEGKAPMEQARLLDAFMDRTKNNKAK